MIFCLHGNHAHTFLCDDPVVDNLLAGALMLPEALGLPAQSIGVNKGNLDVLCVASRWVLVWFCLPCFGSRRMVFLRSMDLLL